MILLFILYAKELDVSETDTYGPVVSGCLLKPS